MIVRARISGGADFSGSSGGLAPPARRGLSHTLHEPFARGRDVDQDPVSDSRVWQPVRLIHPATNGARMAARIGGKRFKVGEIAEKICVGHRLHGPCDSWTVHPLLGMSWQEAIARKSRGYAVRTM